MACYETDFTLVLPTCLLGQIVAEYRVALMTVTPLDGHADDERNDD